MQYIGFRHNLHTVYLDYAIDASGNIKAYCFFKKYIKPFVKWTRDTLKAMLPQNILPCKEYSYYEYRPPIIFVLSFWILL